jgi:acyl-[acyl carrier protein]--UDP-N-acetylglucosamine O-acyltransferase
MCPKARGVIHRLSRYMRFMGNTLFLILIVAAMIATVVALVRGIIAFLRTTEEDLKGGGINQSGLKQNRMMRQRIAFQAIAVILVILLLIMSRGS